MKPSNIKTKGQARDFAVRWQSWISRKRASYYELSEWSEYFRKLGKRFGLLREFKENGII